MMVMAKKFRRGWLFILIALLSCTSAKSPGLSEDELRAYLDQKEGVYEEISVQMGLATWAYYTGEGSADLKAPREKFQKLIADEYLNRVVNHAKTVTKTFSDPVLQRRLQVWHRVLTIARVSLDPDALLMQERLEAWLKPGGGEQAQPSPEEIEKTSMDLIKRRNAMARALGFPDFPTLIYEETELGAQWFDHFVKTVETITREPYRRLIGKIKEEKGGGPIALSDIRTLLKGYYADEISEELDKADQKNVNEAIINGIGIRFSDLPIRIVEKKMPEGIGGQGFAIRIPTDMRIVVQPGLKPADLTHEYGHALQYALTRVRFPILKGYEWLRGVECDAYAEGMAQTLAAFQKSPAWISSQTKLSEEEIVSRQKKQDTYAPAFLRYELLYFLFEIELYRNADQSPREVLNRLQKELLLVEDVSDKPVSLEYHFIFATYPVYVQSYLLADVIAWQVHQVLKAKFGAAYPLNPQVGPFLEESFWKNGSLEDWQAKLKKATGRELDVPGYLKSLGL